METRRAAITRLTEEVRAAGIEDEVVERLNRLADLDAARDRGPSAFRRIRKTGVYVCPRIPGHHARDSRYFKAGELVPKTYRFSHERGAQPPQKAAE